MIAHIQKKYLYNQRKIIVGEIQEQLAFDLFLNPFLFGIWNEISPRRMNGDLNFWVLVQFEFYFRLV